MNGHTSSHRKHLAREQMSRSAEDSDLIRAVVEGSDLARLLQHEMNLRKHTSLEVGRSRTLTMVEVQFVLDYRYSDVCLE